MLMSSLGCHYQRRGKEQTMIMIDGIKIIGAVFVIIYVIAVIKGT